jgi:hypothetical protein
MTAYFFVIPAPDQVEGRLQRDSMLVTRSSKNCHGKQLNLHLGEKFRQIKDRGINAALRGSFLMQRTKT